MNQTPRIFTACTPSDTKTFAESALYVGRGGNVKVTGAGGGTVVLKNVASGTFLPITVIAVFDTLTTATDIILIR
jgi:hypothetical protein